MIKPTVTIHNAITGITEVREMTEAEYAQHLEDIANAPAPSEADDDNK